MGEMQKTAVVYISGISLLKEKRCGKLFFFYAHCLSKNINGILWNMWNIIMEYVDRF